MLNRQLFVDIGPSSVNNHQLEELGSSADELLIKVRKPYTITKQRERWTEEEHEKFLEALKLYGRAWRHIQVLISILYAEHIGTKTAIQIRSHAQKFFSKVVREPDTEKSIEIPPPRPKRKPLHPYPRKLAQIYPKGVPVTKQHDNSSSLFTSGSEQDSGSPVSVLSGVGSETVASVVSNPPNSCTLSLSSAVRSEPDETLLVEQESGCFSHSTSDMEDDTMSSLDLASNELIKQDETPMELDTNPVSSEEISPLEGQSTCLKLFGKTVLVAESQHRNSSVGGNPQCYSTGNNEKIVGSDMETHLCSTFGKQSGSCGIPDNSVWSQWHNGVSPLYYCLTNNYYPTHSEQSAITHVPVLWSFFTNLQVPVGGKPDAIQKEENPKEVETSNDENTSKKSSLTESRLDSTGGVGNRNCNLNLLDSQKYGLPKKPSCTFKLKPSENSAFKLVKASKGNHTAGFLANNTNVDGEQVQEHTKNSRDNSQSINCL